MNKLKIYRKVFFVPFFLWFLLTGFTSCNKKSYPCPGLGQGNEADMSMFDEDGKLKDTKGGKAKKKDKANGLQTKKTPKRIKAPRKTHI